MAPDAVEIAIVLRGDRGLEQFLIGVSQVAEHCDRSSGRSRIGTCRVDIPKDPPSIAIVLRGDRGLERSSPWDQPQAPHGLRSFFGAIEDWNFAIGIPISTAIVLRSFFGAIEDWNTCSDCGTDRP